MRIILICLGLALATGASAAQVLTCRGDAKLDRESGTEVIRMEYELVLDGDELAIGEGTFLTILVETADEEDNEANGRVFRGESASGADVQAVLNGLQLDLTVQQHNADPKGMHLVADCREAA